MAVVIVWAVLIVQAAVIIPGCAGAASTNAAIAVRLAVPKLVGLYPAAVEAAAVLAE